MKVHLLMFGTVIGGGERVAATLARGFVNRGWEVRVSVPSSAAKVAAWYREQGVVADAMPDLLGYDALGEVRALRRFIRASNPDVANLHFGGWHIAAKAVLAARLAGKPRCIVTVQSPAAPNDVDTKRLRSTHLGAHLAHAVIVGTHATEASILASGAPARKVHIVPLGVPVPKTSPGRAEARARLGLPSDAFVVGSLARLDPYKGISVLIEAAALIEDPRHQLRLVVGGDGSERSALESLAISRLGDRATFLGYVPDTADLYAALDVFVLPSSNEGFGLVYIEAALHGIPSVGTAVGGIPEAIVDGHTGLLVPVGDPAALANAITLLRDDPDLRGRLGEAACTRAHAGFTEAHMVDGYINVFQAR